LSKKAKTVDHVGMFPLFIGHVATVDPEKEDRGDDGEGEKKLCPYCKRMGVLVQKFKPHDMIKEEYFFVHATERVEGSIPHVKVTDSCWRGIEFRRPETAPQPEPAEGALDF
jgi:hypothetical protein